MRFASLFHDGAVLQRDMPLPVWGLAAPGAAVTVTLAGASAGTIAGPDGRWSLRLPPLPAGGPHVLRAATVDAVAEAGDVLIGEVWLCSGQSNMEWKLAQVDPQDAGKPTTELPRIRLLTVTNPPLLGRQEAVEDRWTPASARSLVAFSAVAGWFGRALHRELGVPIGLICNAWGGTRIQTWISRDGLMRDPLGRTEVRHYEAFLHDPTRLAPGEYASLPDWEARGAPRDTGNRGFAEGWAAPGFDDAAWPSMPMPAQWQQHGHAGSGVFWFRRTVQVPAAWAGRDLDLGLGAIDKHDDTYVNGERVGGIGFAGGPNAWCTPRVHRVPGQLVPADGRLCLAVRVRSHFHHGGMIGPSIEMRVAPAGEAGGMPLHGPWRYAIEQDYGVVTVPEMPWGPGNPNSPYILFDSRVAPLLPYAIRGVIWYQGESNAGQPEAYRRLLPLMINDWRRAWGQGDFPCLQVQLANFRNAPDSPVYGRWPELRAAQAAALAEPQVGLATAIDIGDPLDIHPRNKRDVGERLAGWALATTYGRGGAPCGPLLDGTAIEAGGRVRLRFQHGQGLRTRDGGPVGELTICGLDQVQHPAESAIEGDTLVVWSPQVRRPWAVRYAWSDCPLRCNLVNGDGLPAFPFRSDG